MHRAPCLPFALIVALILSGCGPVLLAAIGAGAGVGIASAPDNTHSGQPQPPVTLPPSSFVGSFRGPQPLTVFTGSNEPIAVTVLTYSNGTLFATPSPGVSVTFSVTLASASGEVVIPQPTVVSDSNGVATANMTFLAVGHVIVAAAVTNSSDRGARLDVWAVPPTLFAAPRVTDIGPTPAALGVLDANLDGKPDVVVANTSSSSLTLLLGAGDGSFAPVGTFATGAGPVALVIADVNSDGIADVIVANSAANSVSILEGTGTSGFLPRTDYPTGLDPESIAAADLNFDGSIDVATANHTGGSTTVLMGDGHGGLGPPAPFYFGFSRPVRVTIADVNGDGWPDVVAVGLEPVSLVAFLNEQGRITAPGDSLQYGQGLALAAYPRGGIQNRIFLVASDSSGPLMQGPLTASAGLATGGGSTFVNVPSGPSPVAAVIADLNGDGEPDVVSASSDGTVTVALAAGPGPTYIRGRPDILVPIPVPGSLHGMSLAVADVNGDGRPDVLLLVDQGGGQGKLVVILQTP